MFADSLGFLANPATDPTIDPQERPNVSVVHLTSVPPFPAFKKSLDASLAEHERFKKIALANKDVIHVRSTADLPVQAPQIGLLFGMQHAPDGITSLGDLQLLSEAGVQFMSLAYDGPSEYGYGFKVKDDGPLTTKGEHLIGWMAECGMIPDLSHASEWTIMDALKFIHNEKLPIVPLISHSGIREVYDHPRNVTHEIMQLLKELKGYIGLPLITFFICPEFLSARFCYEFMGHMAHALVMAGPENVGIGSDCVHRDMSMEQAKALYDKMTGMLKTDGKFGEYFPDRPDKIITDGSRLLALMQRLIRDSFGSQEKADEVCGGNFIAYLKRALPA